MKTSKWQYLGDVNMLDYGGKNTRCIGNRQFQIVELINMDEACGRDNEGKPKYNVALRLVDLNAISPAILKSALECCGIETKLDIDGNDIPHSDELLAEACDSYGCHAPLESWNGNNARKLLRQAYAEANSLVHHSAIKARLKRPVNALGSTAAEFMAGDFTSAMQRGCESGDPAARIMAKMHGLPQQAIDDARPDDFLPYLVGYMDATANRAKESEKQGKISPEYFRGYERGQNVLAGKAPAPGWIQTQPTFAAPSVE